MPDTVAASPLSSAEFGASRTEIAAVSSAVRPTLYLNNAFRITSLQVEAKPRDVKRQAERLHMMESLSQGKAGGTSAYALNPPASADTIRDALKKLNDPELRIIDEFFWFWPIQTGNADQDPALHALNQGDDVGCLTVWARQENDPQVAGSISVHNLAVAFHLRALDGTLHQIEEKNLPQNGASDSVDDMWWYWNEAAERWTRTIRDDQVWERYQQHVRRIDDPRVKSGLPRALQKALPEALGRINAEIALRFAQRGAPEEARRHVQYLHDNTSLFGNVARVIDETLKPARQRLQQRLDAAQTARINDPQNCAAAAREVILIGTETVAIYKVFEGDDSRTAHEMSDEAATLCINCYLDELEKTKDEAGFIRNLTELRESFTTSPEVAQRIEKLVISARHAPVSRQLSQVHAACEKMSNAKNAKMSGAELNLKLSSPGPAGLFILIKSLYEREMPAIRQGDTEGIIADEFSNDFAIAARHVSLVAFNVGDDLTLALAASEFASRLARTDEMKQKIAEDLTVLRNIKAENACHYCGNDAENGVAAEVKYVKEESNGRSYMTFTIPRCRGCRSVHWFSSILTFLGGAALIWLACYAYYNFVFLKMSPDANWLYVGTLMGAILITIEACAFFHFLVSNQIARLNSIRRFYDVANRPNVQKAIKDGYSA